MRLFLATLTMALALSSTALGRPAAPEPGTNSQHPAVTTDKRAPDQQAPGPAVAAGREIVITKAHRPAAAAPTPASGDGTAVIIYLIGLGAAMVLIAGGYLAVRYRHRIAIADDLVVEK
jgi:hypothetical protein